MEPHRQPGSLRLIDADDRIIADVLCVRCACNLRNLLVSDRCPNCYHPVSDSVHGDYLIHADKPLVRSLAEAARVLEFGLLILGGLIGLALLAALISARVITELVEYAFNIVYAGAMIAPVIASIGLILLTSRHAAAYYRVRCGNRRWLLRGGLTVLLVLSILSACALIFGRAALTIATVLWFAVPLAAFYRGLESLMRRVPNKQLASFARTLLVGLAGFSLLSMLIHVANMQNSPEWEDSRIAFSAICSLGGIALGVATHQLIVRVRKTLQSIAR